MNPYDLIVTSCNRFDLLQRTLNTFFEFCDQQPAKVIVSEDSGKPVPEFVYAIPNVIVLPSVKLGQIRSIDRTVALVESDYFFHLEDDWEFYRTGFIKESFQVLESEPDVINYWLRERTDTNGHPIVGDYLKLGYMTRWNGFTFNPTLKRMCDYRLVKNYAHFWRESNGRTESRLGKVYRAGGFRAKIAPKGFVKHIGRGRHVKT